MPELIVESAPEEKDEKQVTIKVATREERTEEPVKETEQKVEEKPVEEEGKEDIRNDTYPLQTVVAYFLKFQN